MFIHIYFYMLDKKSNSYSFWMINCFVQLSTDYLIDSLHWLQYNKILDHTFSILIILRLYQFEWVCPLEIEQQSFHSLLVLLWLMLQVPMESIQRDVQDPAHILRNPVDCNNNNMDSNCHMSSMNNSTCPLLQMSKHLRWEMERMWEAIHLHHFHLEVHPSRSKEL